jgi:DNA repair exonuclease SbcCD ATPase subunit
MLNKHANMKTALDPFSKGNVFEGVTEQKFGKDFAMLPGEALVRILDRTELGGEGVAQWIAQDRTAQDKIRKLLTTEFFPTKDAAAKRTAEDFENFMRKRGNILEKAGLLPEFKDLETMRRTAEQRITSAEEALETAKQKAARTQERTSIEETERQLELDVLKNRADPVRAESQRAVQDLASARSMKDSAERLAGDLRSARIDPENLHTKLEGYIDRLNKYDPEHFTNKMRNDAIEELAKMKKAYTDSRDQLKYDKDLRTYALLRLSTDLGIGLSGYGVYRLGQGPGGH